mmetsp:Transcript_20664/g.25057  ORF Transcript_20664/g.25057 Transcript_20664/m.25057 type:complete len:107 (-) Transcript_20664:351-671(-)
MLFRAQYRPNVKVVCVFVQICHDLVSIIIMINVSDMVFIGMNGYRNITRNIGYILSILVRYFINKEGTKDDSILICFVEWRIKHACFIVDSSSVYQFMVALLFVNI